MTLKTFLTSYVCSASPHAAPFNSSVIASIITRIGSGGTRKLGGFEFPLASANFAF